MGLKTNNRIVKKKGVITRADMSSSRYTHNNRIAYPRDESSGGSLIQRQQQKERKRTAPRALASSRPGRLGGDKNRAAASPSRSALDGRRRRRRRRRPAAEVGPSRLPVNPSRASSSPRPLPSRSSPPSHSPASGGAPACLRPDPRPSPLDPWSLAMDLVVPGRGAV